MFQFTQFPLPALCVQTRVTPHDGCRVSPFGHPRVRAQSAAHRGFSQPLTSFIGSRRQGIHRWPFVAWITFKIDLKMLVFAMQFSRSKHEDARQEAGRASGEVAHALPQNEIEDGSHRLLESSIWSQSVHQLGVLFSPNHVRARNERRTP